MNCNYSAAHKNVKATEVIDCGPVVGKVQACGKCADLYRKMS